MLHFFQLTCFCLLFKVSQLSDSFLFHVFDHINIHNTRWCLSKPSCCASSSLQSSSLQHQCGCAGGVVEGRAEPKLLKKPGYWGWTKMEALVAILWVGEGRKCGRRPLETFLLLLFLEKLFLKLSHDLWKWKFDHILCLLISSCSVLEKDPVGSKVPERNVFVSNSLNIKIEYSGKIVLIRAFEAGIERN